MRIPFLYIKLLNRRIHSFHFFGVLGFIIGTLLGIVLSQQAHLYGSIILLMGAIGAAIFFGLTFLSKWITGGETIVYYHHEITIIIVCAIVLYLSKLPILPYLDITLLGIGTFLAFGRIGCYSVGCCHGRPHKHGVKYGQQHVDAGFTWYYKDVPLLPVQLIESAYVFITVIVGIILLLNHVAPGTVLVCYTVIYGLMRYILEFFRGDPERPLWYGISEAQWNTLVLITVAFGMSRVGWLPQYGWHPAILIILSLISVIVILYYRKNEKYILFSPPHIKQLAEGLNALDNANKASSTDSSKNKTVNIYITKAGLSISCGNYSKNGIEKEQYTISLNDASFMNKKSSEKIAELIALIKKHSASFDIIEKQGGIYHILFSTTRLMDR